MQHCTYQKNFITIVLFVEKYFHSLNLNGTDDVVLNSNYLDELFLKFVISSHKTYVPLFRSELSLYAYNSFWSNKSDSFWKLPLEQFFFLFFVVIAHFFRDIFEFLSNFHSLQENFRNSMSIFIDHEGFQRNHVSKKFLI